MSRFNTAQKTSRRQVTNRAGGPAFAHSPHLQFVTLILTSFVSDGYYSKADETLARLRNLLIEINDWEFVAKAAVYARRVFGMRSITHVLAGEIAHHVSGVEWKRRFFKSIVRRPDDMLEIMGYYFATYAQSKTGRNGAKVYRKIPRAMRRGFADRLALLSEQDLAKYRASGKELSMVDLVNICHPAKTEAINKLMTGSLGSANTWEANLSKAGASASTDAEKAEAKADVWKTMIADRTIGHMALLRNLRNIVQQARDQVAAACELLVDDKRIKQSLVFPYRYLAAYRMLERTPGTSRVLSALSIAAGKALQNVPDIGGRTLVAIDTSGSMTMRLSDNSMMRHVDVAAVFAAALAKGSEVDLMAWANTAKYANVPLGNEIFATIAGLEQINGDVGHGTSLASAFDAAGSTVYDRIVVISDMEVWARSAYSGYSAQSALDAYKRRTGADPFIYVLDTSGGGTTPVMTGKMATLAGYSDKVFDLMGKAEQDPHILISTIENYQF